MLSFNGLALRRSSTLLFEAVDLKIYPGQKLGITGANGCGKSSLFALIRGELSTDQGDFSMIDDLMETLRKPYDEQPEKDAFAARRPEWARNKPGCSMLSCSS